MADFAPRSPVTVPTPTSSGHAANKAYVDGFQPLDSDLTAIAGISPTNDDLIQRKSGIWVARSMAQVKTDLALTKSDVGLGSVDNTSDTGKPISTATQTALDAKLTSTTARHLGVIPGGATSVTANTTTYTSKGSDDLSITGTFPPSGIITVWLRSAISCSLTTLNRFGIMSFEVRSTNSSGTIRVAASDDNAVFGLSKVANEALCTSCAFVTLTGLPTSGVMFLRAMYKVQVDGTATFGYRSMSVFPSP